MQTPTTIQIRNTIEVLQNLGERIKEHAARSVRQMPSSNQAALLLGQITVNAREQTKQVEAITGQLQAWHAELEQRQRQHVSYRV